MMALMGARGVARGDIHHLEHSLQLAYQSLGRCKLVSPGNREAILRFADACTSQGLGRARVQKYIFLLKNLAEWLRKDFAVCCKADVEAVVKKVESSDYAPWTKHDYKVALKKFFKWMRNSDGDPAETRWIKTTFKAHDTVLPGDLPSEEEIQRLVDAASSIRDKAFIMTLYESGGRIGEVGSLQISDVNIGEQYSTLMLKGKTGSRRVIVVAATPYLNNWISNHPLRGDKDAPLWVSMDKVNWHRAMSYQGLAKILRAAASRAGLKKRVTPHRLRHSRATFLASKLTEAQMNEVFGWEQGSSMPSIYVHLSGRDVDDAILGIYGLREKPEEPSKLAGASCPRCKSVNPSGALHCVKCGLALDFRAAREAAERQFSDEDFETMKELLEEFRAGKVSIEP